MLGQIITVVIAEDHEISRLGLKAMLQVSTNVSILAEVSTGLDAVRATQELSPMLILMDIGLPGIDGIEATKIIKDTNCETKVIMITSHEHDEAVLAALSAGADAYCLKGATGPQLANAITSVMEGAIWLDPGIAKQVVNALSRSSQSRTKPLSPTSFGLSDREMQVLNLLVDGMSNAQMAATMFLSQETVKTHMRHIMEKLQVSDRTQAAVKALSQGLVGVD